VDLPPLQRATQCYAQADLLCVVQVLEHAALSGPELAEGTRLLAFAYARLDRHAEARQAFTRWIAQDSQHKLDRSTTPPAVFTDYTAALLKAHEAELDLEPHLEFQAVLPAPAVTPSDLPRFAPPPPSSRDKADNFALGLLAGVHAEHRDPRASLEAIGQVGLDLVFAEWTVGFAGSGRYVLQTIFDGDRNVIAEGTQVVAQAVVRVSRVLIGDPRHGVAVLAALGGDIEVGKLSPVLGAGLRYTGIPNGSVVGLCVELRDDVNLSSSRQTPLLLIGICLRPAR
jgi:hypothetical protein